MRSRCPEPAMLVAWGEGVLPEPMEAAVGAHLAECGICQRLRQDLRENDFGAPVAVTPMARRTVARPALAAFALAAAATLAFVYWPAPRKAATPAAVETPVAAAAPAPWRLAVTAAPLRLPLAMALVMRGQEPAVANEAYLKRLGAALEPYRAGRHAEAAARLSALAAAYPQAVEAPFYEGVARLLAGDAAAARPVLERARRIGGAALADDLDWYLAAAYERTDAWEQGRPLVEGLCARDGVHREAACVALRSR